MPSAAQIVFAAVLLIALAYAFSTNGPAQTPQAVERECPAPIPCPDCPACVAPKCAKCPAPPPPPPKEHSRDPGIPVWSLSRPGQSPSICVSGAVPGYEPQDGIVVRAPLVMADFLISLVKKAIGPNGKAPGRYVEVGTRNGDIFTCVAHFAANSS